MLLDLPFSPFSFFLPKGATGTSFIWRYRTIRNPKLLFLASTVSLTPRCPSWCTITHGICCPCEALNRYFWSIHSVAPSTPLLCNLPDIRVRDVSWLHGLYFPPVTLDCPSSFRPTPIDVQCPPPYPSFWYLKMYRLPIPTLPSLPICCLSRFDLTVISHTHICYT